MCVAYYIYAGCRCDQPDGKHVHIVYKNPHHGPDALVCGCQQTFLMQNRDGPCPFCLRQILLLVKLQQIIQETAPPGEPVILDYRNRPVFYDADDPRGNMSAEEADEKRAKAQEHRMRRRIMFEATGVLEPGSSIPLGDPLESADGVLQALTAMLGPENIAHENIFNVLPNGF
ncbi:hypothetical protein TWF225_000278 [Orbilia oligospora]|nr:hypothetical protein TWF225_000278 [Orbilia oligospora]KAF3266498.1 hypothetical protein TWF128_010893 [Orbilia oligospora]